MTRWEYVTVPLVAAGFEDATGIDNYHATMNDYGQQGWEMVGVASYPGRTVEGSIVVLVFKRPLAEV